MWLCTGVFELSVVQPYISTHMVLATCFRIIRARPIPSGDGTAIVYMRFSAIARKGGWTMERVDFTTPWRTRSAVPNQYGAVEVTLGPVFGFERHRRFHFSATARFSLYLPLLIGDSYDSKTSERLLGFDTSGLFTEILDSSRGSSRRGVFFVPNWFLPLEGHWGSLIPRFNETYTFNGVEYSVIHFVDDIAGALGYPPGSVLGLMDWQGVLGEEQYAERYRGRIYLCLATVQRTMDRPEHGLHADWIDLVATTVAHEFFHRDQFITSWGGFSNSHIGKPNNRLPGSGGANIDADADLLSDCYESLARNHYKTDKFTRWSVLRWWTGNPKARHPRYPDPEMCAYLWGEWLGHTIGSLDDDWLVTGRQDY